MEFQVLVAEDEVDMLWLISRRVENLGHRVHRASDGNEAIRMIVTGFFQQIFDRITIESVREALGRAIARRRTTSGDVWLSEDRGDTWRRLAATFPRIGAVEVVGDA